MLGHLLQVSIVGQSKTAVECARKELEFDKESRFSAFCLRPGVSNRCEAEMDIERLRCALVCLLLCSQLFIRGGIVGYVDEQTPNVGRFGLSCI